MASKPGWLVHIRRRPLYGLVPLAALVIATWSFWPRGVEVETARFRDGPVTVSFTEEGRTRVRERFVVSAPIAGVVERIRIEPGDPVVAGERVAALRASRAALLDASTRTEATARQQQARAEVASAAAALRAARAVAQERRTALQRFQALARQRLVAGAEVDSAAAQATGAQAEVQVAEARLTAARVREAAAAQLVALQGEAGSDVARLALASPTSGRVLRRLVESEMAVSAGHALLEIGDLRALEVVVDVLTEDAVRIRPGMPVVIRNWGGSHPLAAQVARVEPGAFMKVSALGVEEQRVAVVVHLRGAPPVTLGDGYRVDAEFIVWHRAAVPSLPVAAVFRDGARSAVYAVEDGRVRLRRVVSGHFGGDRVEIRDGLQPGAVVVLYPDERLRDGVRVRSSRGAP